MTEIVHASSSWRDQHRIIDCLEKVRSEDLALRFLQALDETLALIAEFPDLGHPWESPNLKLKGLRYWLVKGFENYLVLYRRSQQHVLITRIFHASQNIEEKLS